MNKPRLFISAVSSEFKTTRQRVANILTRLGYEPEMQDIFGSEPGDLREVLRNKINACSGLIQIVGHGYGAEPPAIDSNFGRVSYTQFEFLYASHRGTKTWLLFAGDSCARDYSMAELDLPHEKAHLNPLEYQAERRQLQQDYRERSEVGGGNHVRYNPANDTELDLTIERLRNDLDKLRWRSRAIVFLVFIFLTCILVGLWYVSEQQRRAEGQRKAEDARIVREMKAGSASTKAGLSAEELLKLLPERYAEARRTLDNEAKRNPDQAAFAKVRDQFETYLHAAEDAISHKDMIRLHDTTKKLVSLIQSDQASKVLPREVSASLFANLGKDLPIDLPGRESGSPAAPKNLRLGPRPVK